MFKNNPTKNGKVIDIIKRIIATIEQNVFVELLKSSYEFNKRNYLF